MGERIFQLTVSSPQELQSKITAESKKGGPGHQFVAIAISAPNVYSYPFQLTNASRKEIIPQLIQEAVALSSINADDIELDFQIFGIRDNIAEGVFVCMPKKLLEQYINACDRAGLIPVHFTSHLLSCIGGLFQKHKKEQEHFAILDFTKGHTVNVAVFCKGKCEFLRQIHFEGRAEGHSDIMLSLRSACAKSQIKTIGHIYIGGDAKNNRELIEGIKRDTGAQLIQEENSGTGVTFDFRDSYFNVNLLHNYSFALPRRRQMIMISNLILAVLFFFLAMGVFHYTITQFKVNKIRSSYKKADVSYALDLQKKVDALPK